jgi:hypothetical protein
MRKRERRRYLTERYRNRQIRLEQSLNGAPFDFDRRPRSDYAKKNAFLCILKGDYTETGWRWGISNAEPMSAERYGRLRRHSFSDCGRPKCPHCSNPRHNGFGTKKARLTIQEVVAEQQFKDAIYEYLETRGEQDDYED